MRRVPWALVALRACVGIVLATGLIAGGLTDGRVMALFAIAFASDYFDGVVARACGVATRGLRQADSTVDTAFYLVVAAVTYRLHADVIRRHTTALAVCVGTLSVWAVVDVVRWRAAAGFHAWSAKLFAGALGVWAVALYGFGVDGPYLVAACAVGTLSHVEGIAISFTLREHVTDVPTWPHALRLRRGTAADLAGG
ncbi:MAG TPA: CDP-alcohol phosphatidyltransferase family protein [Polyangia bacterium]|nr:CDP-alcohol phosphatidyltransferase family protein [Polyangia bacterium]